VRHSERKLHQEAHWGENNAGGQQRLYSEGGRQAEQQQSHWPVRKPNNSTLERRPPQVTGQDANERRPWRPFNRAKPNGRGPNRDNRDSRTYDRYRRPNGQTNYVNHARVDYGSVTRQMSNDGYMFEQTLLGEDVDPNDQALLTDVETDSIWDEDEDVVNDVHHLDHDKAWYEDDAAYHMSSPASRTPKGPGAGVKRGQRLSHNII